LLLVLTARPEYGVPWASQGRLTELALTRLRPAQVAELMAALTEGRVMPAEVVEQVVRKTDGVPLFVEELTRMVLESGLVREGLAGGYELAGPLPPLAIPATLQDSLMARLDRLATTKVVVQVGATLGRSFSYELLQAVTGLAETPLTLELGKLVEAELLYQRGFPPAATYSFKHALIQDAAYQTLLKSTRQQFHQQIAGVLETRFPGIVQAEPELLAHHYTEAGLTAQAVKYWQRAGQRALDSSANLEAIAHLTTGLRVLATAADTPARAQSELRLQIPLGAAMLISKGHGAPAVKAAYSRARELCQQVGDAAQAFPAVLGLWRFYVIEPQLRTNRELAEQLLELAQRAEEPALLVVAHYTLGATLTFIGEMAAARPHLEAGRDLYDPGQRQTHAFLFGAHDPGVACLAYLGWTLWHLGYPQQAVTASQDSIALARKLAHPFSLAFALAFASRVYQLRRDDRVAQELAAEAVALSTERSFPLWVAMGTILGGWACAMREPGPEGIAQIQRGMEIWRGTGAGLSRSNWLALLADAYGRAGQARAGLPVVAEALHLVDETREGWWEAEVYRLQGELLLQADSAEGPAAATPEECFRRALEVARSQHARSLELRAASSLARLWQSRGDGAAAASLLAPIYNAFTEGFDTADLQEAKQLLRDLARSTVQ
jgi:predicted ATPase